MSIILGIDPGLAYTGWGVIKLLSNQEILFVNMGIIKTSTKDSIDLRLGQIFDALCEVIKLYHPISAAIEETYVNTNFATSLKLAKARAASMLAVYTQNIPIKEYSATTIKKNITGFGGADKKQIAKVLSLWIKDFDADNNRHDAFDAVAIAVCHSRYGKRYDK